MVWSRSRRSHAEVYTAAHTDRAAGREADNYFGVIGQDLLSGFSSYTIDLRDMSFSVPAE